MVANNNMLMIAMADRTILRINRDQPDQRSGNKFKIFLFHPLCMFLNLFPWCYFLISNFHHFLFKSIIHHQLMTCLQVVWPYDPPTVNFPFFTKTEGFPTCFPSSWFCHLWVWFEFQTTLKYCPFISSSQKSNWVMRKFTRCFWIHLDSISSSAQKP